MTATVPTVVGDAELADLYDAAADYIEMHGWARGELRTRAGEVCLSGALSTVAIDQRSALNGVVRWRTAMDRLRRSPTIMPHHPVVWNDTIANDQYEVIDLLRNTAKELRNAH